MLHTFYKKFLILVLFVASAQNRAQTSISDFQVPNQNNLNQSERRTQKENFFLSPDLFRYVERDRKNLQVSSEQIALPGLSNSIPSAFGANFGLFFAGLSLVDRVRSGHQSDAVMALGFGAGNSKKNVGLSTVIGIYDLKGNFGQDGAFSFKLHRQLGDGSWSVSVGALDALIWGPNVNIPAYYSVAGKFIQLKNSVDRWLYGVLINAGVGTARFSSSPDEDIKKIKKDSDRRFHYWGPFASIGVGIIRPLAASAAWTGNNLNFGLSLAPLRNTNVVLSFVAKELIQRKNNSGIRYTYTISYSHAFDWEHH